MRENQTLPGAIKASVNSSNYYQADHFSIEFAASAAPTGSWDIDPPLLVDVQISLDDGAGWVSMIIGEVDHLTLDPVTGLLSCDGRDLSARLIEAKTQEAFVNKTASEVASILAGRHGLTAQVTKTTTLVGRYYEQDHSRLTLDEFSRTTTEWDLLVYLAQREGFDCFVFGTTLHFQPSTEPDADPFVIQWTQPSPVPRLNVTTIRMERSLTLAKDVQVDVRSWNSRQAKGFTKTSKAIGGRAASASGTTPGGKANTTQRYVIVRPNLTEDQAQKLANQAAADITRHERVVAVDMPGELGLTPRNMVRLQGTSTSFDQAYFVDHIDRSISYEEGFRQSLRLKNTSPRTQTQI
jgi:phage protein D